MLPITPLNPRDKTPLFRQLHAQMKGLIESGELSKGSRLPATRELAGQIGLYGVKCGSITWTMRSRTSMGVITGKGI
jgi:DNA-binding transcriptional MocR family regulator